MMRIETRSGRTFSWWAGGPFPNFIPSPFYSISCDGDEAAIVISMMLQYQRERDQVREQQKMPRVYLPIATDWDTKGESHAG